MAMENAGVSVVWCVGVLHCMVQCIILYIMDYIVYCVSCFVYICYIAMLLNSGCFCSVSFLAVCKLFSGEEEAENN